MPAICWGSMGRTADDPTTIAEYIEGEINRHNTDPSAHNLDDYAIFNHRNDDLLDHPDYAVITDKIDHKAVTPEKSVFYAFITYFKNYGLSLNLSDRNSLWSSLYENEFIMAAYDGENLCYAYSSFGSLPSDWGNEDIFVDFIAKSALVSGAELKFKVGGGPHKLGDISGYSESFPAYGFYFDVGSGELYAFYFSDTGVQTYKILDYTAGTYYKLTIRFVGSELMFFVDGVKYWTVSSPTFDSMVANEAGLFMGSDHYTNDQGDLLFTVRYALYSQLEGF